MGRRGTKPTPTINLVSWRKNTRKGEPAAEGDPVCPAWFSGDERAVWDEVMPLLGDLKVLGAIDAAALARYCCLESRFRQLTKFINENDVTYTAKGKNGKYVAQRPEVNIMLKISAQLRQLQAEFGMTPAARTALKVQGKQELDPLGKLRQQFGK